MVGERQGVSLHQRRQVGIFFPICKAWLWYLIAIGPDHLFLSFLRKSDEKTIQFNNSRGHIFPSLSFTHCEILETNPSGT